MIRFLIGYLKWIRQPFNFGAWLITVIGWFIIPIALVIALEGILTFYYGWGSKKYEQVHNKLDSWVLSSFIIFWIIGFILFIF